MNNGVHGRIADIYRRSRTVYERIVALRVIQIEEVAHLVGDNPLILRLGDIRRRTRTVNEEAVQDRAAARDHIKGPIGRAGESHDNESLASAELVIRQQALAIEYDWIGSSGAVWRTI